MAMAVLSKLTYRFNVDLTSIKKQMPCFIDLDAIAQEFI